MNISENIYLFACMYLVLPIIYVMLLNLSRPKKNIILGVTLPHEARQDEAVLAVCRLYRRHLSVTCLILTAVALGAFMVSHISIVMTYLLTWLLAAIVAPFISYAIYHRKLKNLKQERKWFSALADKVMLDTKVSYKAQHKLSAWLFAPSFIISLLPMLRELYNQNLWDPLTVYGVNALLVACFYLFYLILYRQKAEIVDSDTGLSLALTQVRRYNWGKVWIALSYTTALFNLCLWLFIRNNTGILVSTAVYLAVTLFVCIDAEFSTRRAQERLTANSGKDPYVDSDKYWLIGMFYYNPHDKHIMINARWGINTTINLAHPAGKAIMGLSLLILLAMPFFGLWMISEEFTPLSITVTDNVIEASHTSPAYSIPLDEVEYAELLQDLPPTIKIAGTGMSTLLKGKFRVEGSGLCSLCLNPQTAPFILIQTADKTYILGAQNSTQTREAYNLLQARI